MTKKEHWKSYLVSRFGVAKIPPNWTQEFVNKIRKDFNDRYLPIVGESYE